MKNTARFFCLMILTSLLLINYCKAESNKFYAYYTKVQHSATDYMGKYADIIVVLGDRKQLEFTRRTGYLPLWRTSDNTYLVDDLFPGKDQDYEFDYNYVRLIRSDPDKIVVQWRYITDIQALNKANEELDPLIIKGFTGVVEELFIIYPDGRIEREIREATNTRIDDWLNPKSKTLQTIKLTDSGIDHGQVIWGNPGPFYPREAVKGNPVKTNADVINPIRKWSFDEGMTEHKDYVMEEVTRKRSIIEGLMTTYKKGVSGTALAFDGYYTGIKLPDEDQPWRETQKQIIPAFKNEFSLEAWIALDVLPYNIAPIIHQSVGFGKEGYYLGIDPYGYPFITINGTTVKSAKKIPLYKWAHIAATAGAGDVNLYIDKDNVASAQINNLSIPALPVYIGLNNEKERCTDFVRSNQQNLLFIYGIQGLLDEVKIYDKKLSAEQISESYKALLPTDCTSNLAKGVLPGEIGTGQKFGAFYKKLQFHELWDNMWRVTDFSDIVVKFDNIPTSIIYWRGTNFAPNWVTDNNRWMADQSSEIGSRHGCSEHMADKQNRSCFSTIIENTPARVVIHWRYPCVDVSYLCTDKRNWTDEYHTIYPDGTAIRKVVWNKDFDKPGFQDIQFLTNPGETPLDVVDIQAMTVANTRGEIEKLLWKKPNVVPKITIDDACIELLNSKSKFKVFTIFQGGEITPWGEDEQSEYIDDPFAGPWNHWPVHLVPSDGRYAVDADRVTHFALGANDHATEFGSTVFYGFTDQPVESLIPIAKAWRNPPSTAGCEGGKDAGYDKDQKAFVFLLESEKLSFTITATKESPVVNPAFVIHDWNTESGALIKVNGKTVREGADCRVGLTRDTNGKLMKIIWLRMYSEKQVALEITQEK